MGVIGEFIVGSSVCFRADGRFEPRSSPRPGLSLISGFGDARLGNEFGLFLPSDSAYQYGFESGDFGPFNRIPSETGVHDQFYDTEGLDIEELNIYRNGGSARLEWATFGLLAATSEQCFFGIGVSPSSVPTTGAADYSGIADGLVTDGSGTHRLFGSRVTITINYATGAGLVRLDLVGRDDPFGNFQAEASGPATTLSGAIGSTTGGFSGELFSLDRAFSGRFVMTLLGPQGRGAGLAFVADDGAGLRIYGAAGLDRQ